jgi:hypothetical protein
MPETSTAERTEPDRSLAAAPARPAGLLGERWTQWVALTTTVLAVSAAISSLKGAGLATRVQLATARENDRWSQYQAKSIKENLLAMERSLLEVQALEAREPAAKAAIAARLAKLGEETGRYEREKAQLRAEAEGIQAQEESGQKAAGSFGLAVMLLQIAIMLSSVGALMKKPAMWMVGLVFGAAGLAYMANGFFGWF